jgi:hypothetical protein
MLIAQTEYRIEGRNRLNALPLRPSLDGITRTECIRSVVGGCMADTKTLIEQAYSAFNKRDIDGA